MFDNLSPDQMQFIDQLRQRKEAWGKLRWFLLFGGLVLALSGALVPIFVAPDLVGLYEVFPDEPEIRTSVAFGLLGNYVRTCALSAGLFVLGLGCEVFAAIHWRDDPAANLLLSLTQNKSNTESTE